MFSGNLFPTNGMGGVTYTVWTDASFVSMTGRVQAGITGNVWTDASFVSKTRM